VTKSTAKIVCLLLFAVLSFQSAQAAAGLLLYTAGGSPYVNAVQYETFSSPSAHLSYVTVKGGQKVQVRSDGIIANIPYPSSGAEVDQDEASGWIAQAEMFAGRYPQYATLLQSIGELWRRKLETTKVAQAPAPVTPTGSSALPKSTGAQAPKSVIAVLKNKSGQIFKKVTITRFDGDNAIINYAEGIGRVPLSDFGDLSALPSDVKLAIEKVTAAINEAKNKAEAERIAKEEKERAAKEAEEQRLARLKQEQLERSEQSKKTQEVLAHLAVAGQERIANEKREQERLANEKREQEHLASSDQSRSQESPQSNASNSEADTFKVKDKDAAKQATATSGNTSGTSNLRRGPEINHFQLGMTLEEFTSNLERIYPGLKATEYIKTASTYQKIGDPDYDSLLGANEHPHEIRFQRAKGSDIAHVRIIGPSKVVNLMSLSSTLMDKMFNSKSMKFDDFCQNMINNYDIPQLKGYTKSFNNRVYERGMEYRSKDGWGIAFQELGSTILVVTPKEQEVDHGFGK